MVQRLCIVDGCFDLNVKWGMCSTHSELWKLLVRNEKATKLFGWSDKDRFNYYLIKAPSEEIQKEFGAKPDCWVWKGALSNNGYGLFKSALSKSGKSQHIHLFALSELAGVALFPDEETDHRCRFRPCANPEHLERVTHQTNTLRGIGPTAKNARKQYCSNNHEFTPENTRRDANGGRSCIACQKELTSSEEYKAARRDAYEPITGIRGKGQYQSEREECSEGHLLTEDNVILEKVKKGDSVKEVRRCRICTRARQRERHAAQQGDELVPGVKKADCVTKKQAAEMMGIAPTYFPTFTKRNQDFPEPIRRGSPSYFLKSQVDSWIQANEELLRKVCR